MRSEVVISLSVKVWSGFKKKLDSYMELCAADKQFYE